MSKIPPTGTGRAATLWLTLALMLGLIPQGLAEAAITASLPDMARDLGAQGELTAQMMLGMSALGLVIGALASGRILEWAGTRVSLLGALGVFGLAGCAGLFVTNVTVLLGSRILVGFAASCFATTCLWAINAEFTGEQRARFFSGAGATGGISTLVGVILGGALTQHLGWRMCFLVYPGFALAALPIVLKGVGQTRPPQIARGQDKYLGKLLPLYGVVMVFYAIIGMASMQLPFLLQANGAQLAGPRALIQALPGLAAIIGASLFALLQQRFGATRSFVASMAFLVGGLLLFSITHGSLVLPAIGAAATGFCMGLSGPYFYHTVAARTDIASVGRYLGYLNAFTFLGVFLNPMIAEPLKAQVGGPGLYLLGAGLIVAIGLLVARMPAGRAQPTTPAPAH